jgi:hypothetical protein
MRYLALILLSASLALAQPAPVFPSTSPASAGPTTRPSPKTVNVDQTLTSMLRPPSKTAKPLDPVTDPPATDVTTGGFSVAPIAPSQAVLREGTIIVDRVGRLTRGSDSTTMEFNFDSDGKTLKDPPVILVPNLKLMSMEDAVKNSNRDLRFRITGTVTEYRGRNYVLVDKVVVVPDAAQQF